MEIKKVARVILIVFYFIAGLNHFFNPDFYLPLIPDYFPQKDLVNIFSGIIEVALSIGVIFPLTRKWSLIFIILMLVAFIPSHIHFINIGACVHDGLCVPEWVAWLRLFPIHFLLMAWAWWVR